MIHEVVLKTNERQEIKIEWQIVPINADSGQEACSICQRSGTEQGNVRIKPETTLGFR
jgi:hypothetical protein